MVRCISFSPCFSLAFHFLLCEVTPYHLLYENYHYPCPRSFGRIVSNLNQIFFFSLLPILFFSPSRNSSVIKFFASRDSSHSDLILVISLPVKRRISYRYSTFSPSVNFPISGPTSVNHSRSTQFSGPLHQ